LQKYKLIVNYQLSIDNFFGKIQYVKERHPPYTPPQGKDFTVVV